MPNWCCDELKVEGKPELVKQFILDNYKYDLNPYDKNSQAEYVLDFEVFDPTPLKDKIKGTVIDNWYEWRIEHWGCKWSPSFEQSTSLTFNRKDGECEEIYSSQFTGELVYNIKPEEFNNITLNSNFFTPWGPPGGIFEQWEKRYRKLGLEIQLKFYEPGCCIMGEWWFSGDDEHNITVDADDEEAWLFNAIDEGWESIEFYIDECVYWLEEMHADEPELLKKLIPTVTKKLEEAELKDAVKLIIDIHNKFDKWCENIKNK